MILFCCKYFCGTLVICNPNLQTLITFYKNARVNKLITRKNYHNQQTKQNGKRINLAPGEAHPGPATPARLPPPTCSRLVRHLLDAVSPPWPRAPLQPSLPSPAPSRLGRDKGEAPSLLDTPAPPFPSSSPPTLRGKFFPSAAVAMTAHHRGR